MINFKKYFFKHQNEKIFTQILFALFLIVLILVTIVFLLIYQSIKSQSLEQAYTDELENIVSISYSSTIMNDTVDALLNQLYENPKIHQLIYTNSPDNFDIINAISYFNEYVAASHWIESAYIYCAKENSVVYSQLRNNTYQFGRTQVKDFWDKDYLNYLCSLSMPLKAPTLRDVTATNSPTPQKVFTYYLPVKNHSRYYDGMYVINIRADRLIELCYGIANHTSRQIIIADSSENYYTSTTQLMNEESMALLLKQIYETDNTYGHSSMVSNDNKVFCTWNKEENTQFAFVSCIPEATILQQVNTLRFFLFFFYLSALVISCCAILFLSHITNTAYKNLQKQYENTAKKYQLNHGFIKDTLLRNFLSAKGDLSIITENFSDNNIDLQNYKNNSLVLMEIKGELTGNSMQNPRTILQSSLDHMLCNKFHFELVDVLQNRLLLILECRDPSVISELLFKLSAKLMEANGQNISGVFAIDVGCLIDVPSTYKQLASHLELLYFYPTEKFVDLRDLNKRNLWGYPQIKTVTNKFIYELNEQRFKEASNILSEFFDKWFEPLSDVRLTLEYLIKELNLYIDAFFYKYAVNTNFDMQMFQNNINHCESSNHVKNHFLNLVDDIQCVYAMIGQRSKYVDDVIDIIHKNYQNPNLSVDTLADDIGLSASHMQSVFKSTTGISIARYLRHLRLEKTTELLTQTDISINDIASQTGFGNVNYFYATFKKHYSMTPNEYRIQNKTHITTIADSNKNNFEE